MNVSYGGAVQELQRKAGDIALFTGVREENNGRAKRLRNRRWDCREKEEGGGRNRRSKTSTVSVAGTQKNQNQRKRDL